jgi:hypothetical protein
MNRLNVAFAGVIVASGPIAGCSRAQGGGETELGSPVALQLRAMNMLYEAIKMRGSMVIVPSSAVENHGTRSECW